MKLENPIDLESHRQGQETRWHKCGYLRPAAAAKYLGIARSTLFAWCAARSDFPKQIPLGGRVVVFSIAALDQFVDRRREEAAQSEWEVEARKRKRPALPHVD
jgi:predicted DNA-binding transcriptional regulator AlpA